MVLSQVIIIVLDGLTKLEKHESTTDQKLSYIHKITRLKLLNNCFVVILVYFFIEVGGFLSLKRLDIETLGNVDINTFRLWIKDVSFIVLGNCLVVCVGKWIIWV